MAKTSKAPKVGDPFLLHGERHVVATVGGKGGRITVEHAKHRDKISTTLLPGELMWSEDEKAWTLPGRTEKVIPGQLPKLVRGPAPKEG